MCANEASMVGALYWEILTERMVRHHYNTCLISGLCRAIADAGECVVVNVGYRHAPEFPYPTPVDDCFAAVLWVSLFDFTSHFSDIR